MLCWRPLLCWLSPTTETLAISTSTAMVVNITNHSTNDCHDNQHSNDRPHNKL
jgi:hypothetical protein